MSLKLHFLHMHRDKFPLPNEVNIYFIHQSQLKTHSNCFFDQATDEQGERFHQDIKPIERRYAGKVRLNMLADFASFSMRESADVVSKNRPHFMIDLVTFTFETVL